MNSIPVLHVEGPTLAAAFENALVALYTNGTRFKTQYDKPDDPESIDATMNITAHEPLTDPMIHQAFPGGIDTLREYVMEVQGAKDHWVKNMNDPNDTRWEYTYHQRLASYGSWREMQDSASVITGPFCINQVEKVIEKLVEQPYTRQAQMITWMPNIDYDCYDPPCLQSIWYRIVDDEEGTGWLNCNIRFRSNDAWGASFMNMFGFTMFNKEVIVAEVEKRTGRPVKLARLNWHADSYHIYGKDIAEARARLFDRIDSTNFEDRTMNFNDEIIHEIYEEAEILIKEKIEQYDATH
jgi:thymidylate synthase